MFFKQLFNCHSKTGIEFYYRESASIPIRIKVSARRLMYWWHKSELIYTVYSTVSGDWINLLEVDKQQFKITLSDREISCI